MAGVISPSTCVLSLSNIIARELGLRFVVGLELECYPSLLRLDGSDTVERLKTKLACFIDGGLTISGEQGKGQVELQFRHRSDLTGLLSSLELAKAAIHEFGARSGDRASFQSRPHFSLPGSGLHVNVSFVPALPIGFADGMDQERAIRRAVVGLLLTMRHGMIFFAPNIDSYFRFRWQCDSADYRFACAPRCVTWGGKSDRSVSVRLIRSPSNPNDWRIEHRVSGADARPSLVLAALLVGVASGFDPLLTDSIIQDTLDFFSTSSEVQELLPLTLKDSEGVWEEPPGGPFNVTGRFGQLWSPILNTSKEDIATEFWRRLNEFVLREAHRGF